jgi:hypothetical protein
MTSPMTSDGSQKPGTGFKTGGDCTESAESPQQMGTVPSSEQVLKISSSEVRSLGDGAWLHVVRSPDGTWRIRLYEFGHLLTSADGGKLTLWHSDGLPDAWIPLKFDNPEQAETFVWQEIAASRCPRSEG